MSDLPRKLRMLPTGILEERGLLDEAADRLERLEAKLSHQQDLNDALKERHAGVVADLLTKVERLEIVIRVMEKADTECSNYWAEELRAAQRGES
jgi:uncharacterized coiled-coil protein SlyX